MTVGGEGNIFIGTSGFFYRHWRGPFYPPDLPSNRWLEFYAQRFNTVELNRPFYRLPDRKSFAQWAERVPEDFVFAVKAPRTVTHFKHLAVDEQTISHFLHQAGGLGRCRGPVLFQLPPGWGKDAVRLKSFLDILPDGVRFSIEFRNQTWWDDEIYDLLCRKNVAFCLFEWAGRVTPRVTTADFIYVRLHGPLRRPYEGRYSGTALKDWAEYLADRLSHGIRCVYCYFDNDQNGYAPQDALRLRRFMEERMKRKG